MSKSRRAEAKREMRCGRCGAGGRRSGAGWCERRRQAGTESWRRVDGLQVDARDDGTFEVRAKKFLSPMMAIGGSVSTTDGDVGVAVNWTGRY